MVGCEECYKNSFFTAYRYSQYFAKTANYMKLYNVIPNFLKRKLFYPLSQKYIFKRTTNEYLWR